MSQQQDFGACCVYASFRGECCAGVTNSATPKMRPLVKCIYFVLRTPTTLFLTLRGRRSGLKVRGTAAVPQVHNTLACA